MSEFVCIGFVACSALWCLQCLEKPFYGNHELNSCSINNITVTL